MHMLIYTESKQRLCGHPAHASIQQQSTGTFQMGAVPFVCITRQYEPTERDTASYKECQRNHAYRKKNRNKHRSLKDKIMPRASFIIGNPHEMEIRTRIESQSFPWIKSNYFKTTSIRLLKSFLDIFIHFNLYWKNSFYLIFPLEIYAYY